MDNQQQEVVKPVVNEDVKQDSTEATENVPNNSVPYSRFSEVNDKYRELEDKFNGLVKEQESARQKKLQEEGKYQELLVEKDKTIEKLSQDNKDKSEYQGLRRDMLVSELSEDDKKAYIELLQEAINRNIPIKGVYLYGVEKYHLFHRYLVLSYFQ